MTTGQVADQQILRGTAGILSWQYLDADGELADPGTVTVGVTRADGTVLVAAGQATVGTGAAPRSYALTATQTAALDSLAVTWTANGTTYLTVAEIVGGYYFTIAQLRSREISLADDQKYPTADLQGLRREVEGEFEEICKVGFVPRYRRERLDGRGNERLMLPVAYPRRILAMADVAIDGTVTAWSTTEIAAIRANSPSGEIISPLRPFLCGRQNVIVAWEHGYDRPPADVRQAAMLRIRHRAVRPKSAIPDRASTFQIEGGSVYRLDQADRTGTGIDEIDAVLDRYTMDIPGIA